LALTGHGFSRAIQLLILVIPSGLQPARNLHFRVFQQPVQPCRQQSIGDLAFSP
jgi:hypothetical protein